MNLGLFELCKSCETKIRSAFGIKRTLVYLPLVVFGVLVLDFQTVYSSDMYLEAKYYVYFRVGENSNYGRITDITLWPFMYKYAEAGENGVARLNMIVASEKNDLRVLVRLKKRQGNWKAVSAEVTVRQ